MALGGVLGNGTKVGYSASSPVSWTVVPQLLDIKFPTFVADDVNTTVHSPSRLKRSMPGMIEVSEMTLVLEADLDEATTPEHDELFTMNQSQQTVWWRAEVPVDRQQANFTAFEFQGYVKSWEPGTPIEDKQTLQVVVKFDGDSFVKYPAGASAM